jgi:hypothetical protein
MEDKSMVRKLSYFSLVLVAFGGLMIGCSDDVSRVTSPAVESQWDDFLPTSADEPGVTFDVEEYISQGYYYPEDETSVDDGLDQYTNDDVINNPSGKPLDESAER